MFHMIFVCVFLLGCVSSNSYSGLAQGRNAIFEFREMITKLTARSALDYLGYGCYCGFGGKGKPVDEVDICCQVHDQCYGNTSTYLRFWKLCSPHLVTYSWTFNDGVVKCNGNRDTCKYKTCMCDKIAVECFAKSKYNDGYKGYSRSLC